MRFKQLLCGPRHKHRRVGRVFHYGNARGVEGEGFELGIYLQNLESGYTLKERKCLSHSGATIFEAPEQK